MEDHGKVRRLGDGVIEICLVLNDDGDGDDTDSSLRYNEHLKVILHTQVLPLLLETGQGNQQNDERVLEVSKLEEFGTWSVLTINMPYYKSRHGYNNSVRVNLHQHNVCDLALTIVQEMLQCYYDQNTTSKTSTLIAAVEFNFDFMGALDPSPSTNPGNCAILFGRIPSIISRMGAGMGKTTRVVIIHNLRMCAEETRAIQNCVSDLAADNNTFDLRSAPVIPRIDRYRRDCRDVLLLLRVFPVDVATRIVEFLPKDEPDRIVFHGCLFQGPDEIQLLMHLFPTTILELHNCEGFYDSNAADQWFESYGNVLMNRCFGDIDTGGTMLTHKTNIPYYYSHHNTNGQSDRMQSHMPGRDELESERLALEQLQHWGALDVVESGPGVLTTVNYPPDDETPYDEESSDDEEESESDDDGDY